MIEPTVTIALAELVRLQGYEQRARNCAAMIAIDMAKGEGEGDDFVASVTRYAGTFVTYVLEGGKL